MFESYKSHGLLQGRLTISLLSYSISDSNLLHIYSEMTPDLSLPSHNPKLNTYGNTNWDNASFVLYTLIDLPHIELIRKASTLGERWMQASEYSDPHLIRTSPNPQLHQQNPQRHPLRPDHHGQGNGSPLRSQRRRGSGLVA